MLYPVSNKHYTPKTDVFSSFQSEPKVRNNLYTLKIHRYKYGEPVSKDTKLKVLAGSLLGSVLPVLLISKYKKINPLKLKYGMTEMLTVGGGGVIGGVLTGLAVDKKTHKKTKIHEGIFQLLNVAIPTILVCPLISLCENNKKLNNIPTKAVMTVGGLIAGMVASAKLANKINDPHDKIPDRKLSIKDSIVNIDEALGVFVRAKFPIIKDLPIENILPLVYSWGGYRAGTSN